MIRILIILSTALVSVSAFACPNLTGDWTDIMISTYTIRQQPNDCSQLDIDVGDGAGLLAYKTDGTPTFDPESNLHIQIMWDGDNLSVTAVENPNKRIELSLNNNELLQTVQEWNTGSWITMSTDQFFQ